MVAIDLLNKAWFTGVSFGFDKLSFWNTNQNSSNIVMNANGKICTVYTNQSHIITASLSLIFGKYVKNQLTPKID